MFPSPAVTALLWEIKTSLRILVVLHGSHHNRFCWYMSYLMQLIILHSYNGWKISANYHQNHNQCSSYTVQQGKEQNKMEKHEDIFLNKACSDFQHKFIASEYFSSNGPIRHRCGIMKTPQRGLGGGERLTKSHACTIVTKTKQNKYWPARTPIPVLWSKAGLKRWCGNIIFSFVCKCYFFRKGVHNLDP